MLQATRSWEKQPPPHIDLNKGEFAKVYSYTPQTLPGTTGTASSLQHMLSAALDKWQWKRKLVYNFSEFRPRN